MSKDNFELLGELKVQAKSLPNRDSNKLDALRRRTEMIIRNIFGQESKYLQDLEALDFYPMVYPSTPQTENNAWLRGQQGLQNLIETMEEELKLFQSTASSVTTQQDIKGTGKQVFVVHGHDEEMKQSVARILSKLGLEPVILHEKPNQGRTVIEKFTDHSQVAFAVILLSPDDVARARNAPTEELAFRARQNVVLELGYFLGRLGRDRVVTIYRQAENFEMPSDYSGVLFVPYDAAGRWQFDLARELKSSGYNVDANVLL